MDRAAPELVSNPPPGVGCCRRPWLLGGALVPVLEQMIREVAGSGLESVAISR